LLGLRYVSDAAVNQGGWHVRGIDVGGAKIAANPELFRSVTQVRPTPVHHWAVRLVGISGTRFAQVPVTQVGKLRGYDRIVAIVAYDEPTETVKQYAPYTLTVR